MKFKNESILTLKQVIEKTGLQKSTIYGHQKKGLFPQSIKLGVRKVGWLESEIDAWMEDGIKARNSTKWAYS